MAWRCSSHSPALPTSHLYLLPLPPPVPPPPILPHSAGLARKAASSTILKTSPRQPLCPVNEDSLNPWQPTSGLLCPRNAAVLGGGPPRRAPGSSAHSSFWKKTTQPPQPPHSPFRKIQCQLTGPPGRELAIGWALEVKWDLD